MPQDEAWQPDDSQWETLEGEPVASHWDDPDEQVMTHGAERILRWDSSVLMFFALVLVVVVVAAAIAEVIAG